LQPAIQQVDEADGTEILVEVPCGAVRRLIMGLKRLSFDRQKVDIPACKYRREQLDERVTLDQSSELDGHTKSRSRRIYNSPDLPLGRFCIINASSTTTIQL